MPYFFWYYLTRASSLHFFGSFLFRRQKLIQSGMCLLWSFSTSTAWSTNVLGGKPSGTSDLNTDSNSLRILSSRMFCSLFLLSSFIGSYVKHWNTWKSEENFKVNMLQNVFKLKFVTSAEKTFSSTFLQFSIDFSALFSFTALLTKSTVGLNVTCHGILNRTSYLLSDTNQFGL